MQEQEVINIRTLHFGDIEIPATNVLEFEFGILGFEDLKRFVIISEEETEPFKWLLAIDEPNIGFPIVDPWLLDGNYNPGRTYKIDEEALFSIVTLGKADQNMTANLKAPIVINIKENKGKQIILPNDKYSPTYVVSKK